VVADPLSDEEHIISGKPEWTYRETCVREWPFKSISKSGDWIIKDEKGNDISNTPLDRYNGIASIEYTISERTSTDEYKEKSDDRSDEYSSIDQGVTYYD
ncbi:MAG: hypothetical protein ACXAEF_12075, partial [Candidatus Thorarchaeota archaeon]